ncbi:MULTISPECIES: hypothetical protein [Sorangium]|uniref:Uncharacterized protein n=1 Tax=Sorangium cellulosum TaxID=56 RepID=A0A4P2R0S7_SORCE|nr:MULTISPECIES: hypothetical protein [Sorangium]AUX36121.1 hypothetical protein SOCE836_083270 [Sorangium cellulosum]WCQ95424.1 hypothetical protein NQZ70_08200 [Sorangium sp. Soce836]
MQSLNAIQLPEELREPPPRPWAALRHARHQLAGVGYALLVWAGLLGVGSLYRHIDLVAMLLAFSFAVMPFVLLYQVLGSYTACRLALRGAPSAAQIYEGVVVTRFGTVNVWHVVVAGQHVRIRADAPLLKSMVVLVTPETTRGKRRVGVYHPKIGICTSLV